MNKFMNLAIQEAKTGLKNKDGGPFGAVIVKDGEIIAGGHNTVLVENDATCHAEINAIRKASKKLNTYDLSDCVLYTTCEPCPMCLSAIIWSNIKTVYFGADRNDAAKIGFRDEFIYKYLSGENKDCLNINQINKDECIEILNNYDNTIY